jgi:hypothetical protein
MAHIVRKIDYSYINIPSRAGHGARILREIKEAGISLLALTGFPAKRGVAQLDLVADKLSDLTKVAKKNAWKLSKPKKGFLLQGDDEVGAVLEPLEKLAAAKINVTAADAVSSGDGRFGMIFWVKPKDYRRAAKVLGAK